MARSARARGFVSAGTISKAWSRAWTPTARSGSLPMTAACIAWYQGKSHERVSRCDPGAGAGNYRVPADLVDRPPAHRAGDARLGRPGRGVHRGSAAGDAGGGDRL